MGEKEDLTEDYELLVKTAKKAIDEFIIFNDEQGGIPTRGLLDAMDELSDEAYKYESEDLSGEAQS